MHISIFTDELAMDLTEALPILKSWGLEWVDLRGRVFGKAFEQLTDDELARVKALLDEHGLRVACLQSSLAKVHLPDAARCQAEEHKLEGIIRAANALDCRLVRSFFYWQPEPADAGALAIRPDMQQRVMDLFRPLAMRAKEAGLQLAFENCGVTPGEVLTMVDLLGEPTWGLAWDCSNSWATDERRNDEVEYLVKYARASKCAHVKAVRTVPGYAEERVDWERVLATLAAAGMPGPVSIETHNPDPDQVDHVEMSRRTYEIIKRAMPTAAPGNIYDSAAIKRPAFARPYEDNPVGFAVIGLGMGHNRAGEVMDAPGARLVGVCDLDPERAQRTGEAFDVPYSTELNDWLHNDEVEVIYVLTETGHHAAVGLQALEAGKHVLTTKPMDANVAACDALIAKAAEKGLLLGVDFGMRYGSDLLTLRRAVEAGWFGRLLSAQSSLRILRTHEYFESNGGWRGTRLMDGGGVLSNQNVHHIDELIYTFGLPRRVRADIYTQNHAIEAEDLAIATWEYADGLVINVYATTCYPQPTWYHNLEIHGTTGAFSASSAGPFERPVTQWYLDEAWTTRPPETVESAYMNAADNFASAVRLGTPLTCDGRDGRRSRAVIDAMLASGDQDGVWVEVE